jgi:hypothetical protein
VEALSIGLSCVSSARNRDQNVVDTVDRGLEISDQLQVVGELDIRQVVLIAALTRHGGDVAVIAAPEPHRLSGTRALNGERGTPRTGAEHRDVGMRGGGRRHGT